jgi:hypothetical protein
MMIKKCTREEEEREDANGKEELVTCMMTV